MSAESDRAAADSGASSSSGGGGGGEGQRDASLSYRYWVGQRGDGKEAAAPAPQPRKLTSEEAASMSRSSSQGSLWNQGGTWEERTLNDWAKAKMTELMRVTEAVQVQGTPYQITTELDSVTGDTTIVVVRNKKKHGYMLDISFKFKGRGEADSGKVMEGTMRINEATFGDIDGTHLEVTVDAGKSGFRDSDKGVVEAQLSRQLLPALQKQLQEFESQLVQR